jgi:hypothetical protein
MPPGGGGKQNDDRNKEGGGRERERVARGHSAENEAAIQRTGRGPVKAGVPL